MFENCKNTKKQGDVGLGICISHFSFLGYTISIPLTDSQDYDLVVDFPDLGLQKIQIKTTNQKSKYNIYKVGLRITGGNSKCNFVHKKNQDLNYDQLFVLTSSNDRYLIPKKIIASLSNSISLGKLYESYKL